MEAINSVLLMILASFQGVGSVAVAASLLGNVLVSGAGRFNF